MSLQDCHQSVATHLRSLVCCHLQSFSSSLFVKADKKKSPNRNSDIHLMNDSVYLGVSARLTSCQFDLLCVNCIDWKYYWTNNQRQSKRFLQRAVGASSSSYCLVKRCKTTQLAVSAWLAQFTPTQDNNSITFHPSIMCIHLDSYRVRGICWSLSHQVKVRGPPGQVSSPSQDHM